MDFSQVRLGARIEFYEELGGPDGGPVNYLAAATKDPAFVGVTCPEQGDYVSAISLAGGEASMFSQFIIGRCPFLPVAYVEHYLVPLGRNEEIPDWWVREWRSASATLVFHVQAGRSEDFRQGALAQALKDQGWSVLSTG